MLTHHRYTVFQSFKIDTMTQTTHEATVLIAGEAGQGLDTMTTILAAAAVRSGRHVLTTGGYESRIRGGHNNFFIRIGVDEVTAPTETADILVAFNRESIDLHRDALTDRGLIVAGTADAPEDERVLAVPYADMGDKRYVNTAALGVLGSLLGLDRDILEELLHETFGKKDEATAAANIDTLKRAWSFGDGHPISFPDLSPGTSDGRSLSMNGNQAVALGALAAGVKACFFYPMSPSTSIALTLAAHAEDMGVIVEQAEDEIAAVNMAVGASSAGAPSVVTTSGGGFALMGEGVSLAAMTETPLVVCIVQRPGPATGLPTRTEQGDLELVLHAGHGEFPRAIFTPGDHAECAELAHRALQTAARYQGPVFLLSDQYQADSIRDMPRNVFERLAPIDHEIVSDAPTAPYRRYADTTSGVSPRLLPGRTEHLVVADSDEHRHDGHITEDLTVRIDMVKKRLRKGEGMTREFLAPIYSGSRKSDLILVGWGSTKGAVIEAAQMMSEKDPKRRVATLHFTQVWPLAPDGFMKYFENAGEVIIIEGNATGQFGKLLRRETGFAAQGAVLRYDGLPITPRYILDALKS